MPHRWSVLSKNRVAGLVEHTADYHGVRWGGEMLLTLGRISPFDDSDFASFHWLMLISSHRPGTSISSGNSRSFTVIQFAQFPGLVSATPIGSPQLFWIWDLIDSALVGSSFVGHSVL